MKKCSINFRSVRNKECLSVSRASACFLFFLLCVPFLVAAQVGINTTNISDSAILEIESMDKGVLFPSMTLDQRDAITLPANGLTIYCNDCCLNNGTGSLYYYNGTDWKSLDSECSDSLVPPCEPATITNLGNGGHFDETTSTPFLFDNLLTYETQTGIDFDDLRLHHDNKDIIEFNLNQTLPAGYQIIIYWSDFELANNLGLIVEFDAGGSTSQPTIDTLDGPLTNSTNVNTGARNQTLTIDIVADLDTITVKSNDDNEGEDPFFLEIKILTAGGDEIEFYTCL